ncbi:MAG: hypothetical protein AB7O88_08950 [Reyranellaceae bacterium]
MVGKARGADAHQDAYRNDIPLDELPRLGTPRADGRSARDLTAGRRDENPPHAEGEVRLRELQLEVEARHAAPPTRRKPQDKLDDALSDTFPASDPVAFLEPKRR